MRLHQNYTIMAYERTLVGNAPPWHCGEQRAKQSRSPFPFLQNFVTLVLVAQDAFLFTQPAVRSPSSSAPPTMAAERSAPFESMTHSLSHCFSQKTHFFELAHFFPVVQTFSQAPGLTNELTSHVPQQVPHQPLQFFLHLFDEAHLFFAPFSAHFLLAQYSSDFLFGHEPEGSGVGSVVGSGLVGAQPRLP